MPQSLRSDPKIPLAAATCINADCLRSIDVESFPDPEILYVETLSDPK